MRTAIVLVAVLLGASPAWAGNEPVRTGTAAYGDWRTDAPGVVRKITPGDMPAPLATRPAATSPDVVAAPAGALPKVPAGFAVGMFAQGLKGPRVVRVAPNGDIFVAESGAGRVRAFRADDSGSVRAAEIFAAHLEQPFGIAFYPPGPNPAFVYVANTTSIVRFPYRSGDLKATAPAEIVVPSLPDGGHWTRDIAFSPDGGTMYVSVGSESNVAEDVPSLAPPRLATFASTHALGAAWGSEQNRADVLAFDPDGRNMRVFATGLRNCSGLAIEPETGALWCAVNERDILGDDLPPDYATRVKEGAFYGWPWYYIGDNQDPRHQGERPDLAGKITLPDVLIQPHSAPLGLTFYEGTQFPADYKGAAFVALHGSWNRARRTGYKVVRLFFKDGKPTGEYEDFLTGFVSGDASVWGRPVDVAVMKDGSLLVTDDGGGAIWRVSYKGPRM